MYVLYLHTESSEIMFRNDTILLLWHTVDIRRKSEEDSEHFDDHNKNIVLCVKARIIRGKNNLLHFDVFDSCFRFQTILSVLFRTDIKQSVFSIVKLWILFPQKIYTIIYTHTKIQNKEKRRRKNRANSYVVYCLIIFFFGLSLPLHDNNLRFYYDKMFYTANWTE